MNTFEDIILSNNFDHRFILLRILKGMLDPNAQGHIIQAFRQEEEKSRVFKEQARQERERLEAIEYENSKVLHETERTIMAETNV